VTSFNSACRIGVVVPSVNTVIEDWFPSVLPANIRLAINRMLIGAAVTAESLREMDNYGIEAARVLATARPSVVIYGCTASSLVGGRAYDLNLLKELRHVTGVPSLTTTESTIRALAHLGTSSLAVCSPYTEELGTAEVAFLEDTGHRVLGAAHLGILGGFELAAPSASEIADLVRQAWTATRGRAEAVFIGCMNLNSHLVIDALEDELGVPVVTATQASLWAALRELGQDAPITGYGRLLREPVSVLRDKDIAPSVLPGHTPATGKGPHCK
jgi:maleate isomerase